MLTINQMGGPFPFFRPVRLVAARFTGRLVVRELFRFGTGIFNDMPRSFASDKLSSGREYPLFSGFHDSSLRLPSLQPT
jgi:hypothetical protein